MQMGTERLESELDHNSTVVLLRDYAKTIGDKIARLRGRTSANGVSEPLANAVSELEITREKLAVADEEISSAAVRYEVALRALEAKNRHYSELFDGCPDGYVLTDATGVIREGNRTFASMLGVHKRFLEGKPLVNFVTRGDVRRYRDSLGGALRGQKDGELVRLRFRPRHGEPVFAAEVARRVVRGVGQRVTSIRWTVRKALPGDDGHKPDGSSPSSA
jgi:PAS domain S-box-containing protein